MGLHFWGAGQAARLSKARFVRFTFALEEVESGAYKHGLEVLRMVGGGENATGSGCASARGELVVFDPFRSTLGPPGSLAGSLISII